MESRASRRRRISGAILHAFAFGSGAVVCLELALIIGYIFVRGIPGITVELLTTQPSYIHDTIGVLPNLKRYLDECKCHLAVSLHDPFPQERLSLMPAQKAWPIEDVVALLRQYDFTGQRRVSFEYTMFAGLNDTPRHADALLRRPATRAPNARR